MSRDLRHLCFYGPMLVATAPPTLQSDLDAAAGYWKQSAPSGCSSESAGYAKLPGLVLGEGTIPDPAESGPCEMTIEHDLSPHLRCLTVVHEYGHWLGLHHSKSRLSPMYPIIGKGAVVPQCERSSEHARPGSARSHSG